jgi:hypothetical protein
MDVEQGDQRSHKTTSPSEAALVKSSESMLLVNELDKWQTQKLHWPDIQP